MKYWHPKPMHWSGIHWWIDGLARPSVQDLEHSWWGQVAQLEQDRWAMQTLPLLWNFMGLQEASAFTAPISLSFFFFWNTSQLLPRSTQSPSDTFLCLCHEEFLFLVQPGQAGSDKGCLSYRDAPCSRHAARNSQINGDLKPLSKMLQGTTIIKIINARNNKY